jgi:hypothetical protein
LWRISPTWGSDWEIPPTPVATPNRQFIETMPFSNSGTALASIEALGATPTAKGKKDQP